MGLIRLQPDRVKPLERDRVIVGIDGKLTLDDHTDLFVLMIVHRR